MLLCRSHGGIPVCDGLGIGAKQVSECYVVLLSIIYIGLGYMNRQRDMISVVPLLGKPFYYIGSLPVAKQLLLNDLKVQLDRPQSLATPLLYVILNLI